MDHKYSQRTSQAYQPSTMEPLLSMCKDHETSESSDRGRSEIATASTAKVVSALPGEVVVVEAIEFKHHTGEERKVQSITFPQLSTNQISRELLIKCTLFPDIPTAKDISALPEEVEEVEFTKPKHRAGKEGYA